MKELKVIVNRYVNKCNKCGKEQAVNVKVAFDAKEKKIYCAPCTRALLRAGQAVIQLTEPLKAEEVKKEETIDNPIMELLERVAPTIQLNSELLARIDSQQRDIIRDLANHDNMLRDLIKKSQAKTTRKKS